MNKHSTLTKHHRGTMYTFLLLAFAAAVPATALATPCIEVTKYCEDAVAAGEPITFHGQVRECAGRELTDVGICSAGI